MVTLLPILLLGFAQFAQQSSPLEQSTQVGESAVLNHPSFTLLSPSKDVAVVPRRILIDTDDQIEGQHLCFTMRTYLFQRRNGFAPEPVGMTTCQPASARRQKRVMGRPRLIPAN